MSTTEQVKVKQYSPQKQQNFFIGKVSLFAGLLFGLVFLGSFFISEFWLAKAYSENPDKFNIYVSVGSVALLVSIVLSIVMSFKGLRSSIGLIATVIVGFVISYIISFSCYFSLLGNSIMTYAFVFTCIALLIFGAIGFMMSDKAAFSLMKISMICMGIYFLVSITGSVMLWFVSNRTYEVWNLVVTCLIGVVIIGSNIFSFYQLKKMSEFTTLNELDSSTKTKLILFQTLNIFISAVQTFYFILRLLLMVSRE